MGTGGAFPYPYPPILILPVTRTHTRQRVQLFSIPVTRQGRRVPAGKNTHVKIWSRSRKQQYIR